MQKDNVVRTSQDATKALWSGLLQTSQPAIAFLAFAGLATTVQLAVRWQIPLPFCALRRWTGIPCPACGSTRSLLAWSEFDPWQAWLFNPLCFLACLMVMGWALLWGAEKLSGGKWLGALEKGLQGLFTWKLASVLAVLNWLYLCLALPK